MAPHVAARSADNPTYPPRFAVPDEKVPWAVPFPGYKPTAYTYARKDASFADPADPKAVEDLVSRFSYEGRLHLEPETGAPVNPAGRTGMCERGRLAKWGPNHAADPIVTRYHPTSGDLQLVVIKRKDTGAWALPGGVRTSPSTRREHALRPPVQADA